MIASIRRTRLIAESGDRRATLEALALLREASEALHRDAVEMLRRADETPQWCGWFWGELRRNPAVLRQTLEEIRRTRRANLRRLGLNETSAYDLRDALPSLERLSRSTLDLVARLSEHDRETP